MPDLLLTLPFALMTASLPAAPMCSIGHAAFFATPAESAGSVNAMAYPLVLRSGAGETPLAFALPGSLADAIRVMERSELVAETLGEHVFDFFLRNKRAEWEQYRSQVTPWELDTHLPVL